MLKIRLQRTGRKHDSNFRVVITDSKNGPKSGKFLEILGSYDPSDKNVTQIKKDRVLHWIEQGAQVSGTVNNLLINQGVIKGDKVNVLPKKTPIIKEAPVEDNPTSPKASSDEAPKVETEAPVVEEVAEVPVEETPEASVKETPVLEEEKKEEVKVEDETPKEEVVAESPAEPTTPEASSDEEDKK